MNQERLIHLIAHRGNAIEFPENTLPAFNSALDSGCGSSSSTSSSRATASPS